MSSPTLLVLGKLGQVGWELCRTLSPLGRVVSADYPEVDLVSGDSLRKWVKESNPDVIVNAAAHTAVDKAESEPEQAMKLNGEAPGILAEEAKRIRALLVHYSADYVFDGAKTEPYTEEDTPNPLSAYGRSKLAGDRAIVAVDGDYLILRLCWVYGTRGNNFLLTIERLAREREKLRVVRDQVGCPTWSRLVAAATALILKQLGVTRGRHSWKGLYHLCAAGATSWHGFAEAIVGLMSPAGKQCRQIEAITTQDYPLPAKRPAYSVLACEKLRKEFGLQLPSWEQGLQLARELNP